MNVLKKLEIEYDGICGTIEEYTSNDNITNYLDKLKLAMSTHDYDSIIYCLKKIDQWYDANILAISSNEWVSNLNSHIANRALIKELIESINEEDSVPVEETNANSDKETIIFLSHKSDDKKYGDALEKFIIGLGVKNEQLIYTSHPLHKIPLDASIYDYLRENFNNEVFMIILWSDKYLESPACLNEMGAAWVTQSDYTNVYVPDFSFGNPKYHECAVDTKRMGAVLNGDSHCKASMLELKDKIEGLFNLKNDYKTISFLLDNFIEDIS